MKEGVILNNKKLIAIEKLRYMLDYSKSSTIATVLAPLLCIPLYWDTTEKIKFFVWMSIMAIAVVVRYIFLRSIRDLQDPPRDLRILNMAVGFVTLIWGLGWFVFVDSTDLVSYLLYQIISLTVLFVGMVGYCINWKTFFAFIIPLKVPEIFFISLNFSQIVWPIALGSMIAFYLALKMAVLFSKSWEKSYALRIKNDALIEQLTAEKNTSLAANLAKSEFIATASHDLRQPLQSINIFIEMIDVKILNENHRSLFNRMRKSILVLNRMFNTLLDISKLDSNFSVHEEDFELREIVQVLEDGFIDLCAEKKIDLSFVGDDHIVFGDSHLVEQILRNLLANAIQYTDQGYIKVIFESDNGLFTFKVEDTGCGIPENDLPLIFTEFYRSDHSRSQYDGLGLGLAIVQRILNKINGHCQVQSKVGKGSVFTVHTQFEIIQPKPFNPIPSGHVTNVFIDSVHDFPIVAATRHLGIIENDETLVQAYRQYFVTAGYRVHIIPHEDEAFQACLAFLPKVDFILSDFRLGPRDGLYFIQKLREEFNDDIPACIVTADTSPQHLQLFSQHKVNVLYKPVEIQTIEKHIESHI